MQQRCAAALMCGVNGLFVRRDEAKSGRLARGETTAACRAGGAGCGGADRCKLIWEATDFQN